MEPTDEQTPADSGAAATTEVPIENSADDTFDDERADGEVVDEQEPAELEGLLQKKGDQGALKLTTLTLAFFCIFFFRFAFSLVHARALSTHLSAARSHSAVEEAFLPIVRAKRGTWCAHHLL